MTQRAAASSPRRSTKDRQAGKPRQAGRLRGGKAARGAGKREKAAAVPRAVADLETPLGRLRLEADEEALRVVAFAPIAAPDEPGSPGRTKSATAPAEVPTAASRLVEQAARELAEYFAGERREFDVPVAPRGTRFQERVWKALRTIPFGATRSYGEVARAIGRPKASRAVGGANHKNPVAIVVPCHRVIGVNRTLVGYGGGLDKKEWLLQHEKAMGEGRAMARTANYG